MVAGGAGAVAARNAWSQDGRRRGKVRTTTQFTAEAGLRHDPGRSLRAGRRYERSRGRPRHRGRRRHRLQRLELELQRRQRHRRSLPPEVHVESAGECRPLGGPHPGRHAVRERQPVGHQQLLPPDLGPGEVDHAPGAREPRVQDLGCRRLLRLLQRRGRGHRPCRRPLEGLLQLQRRDLAPDRPQLDGPLHDHPVQRGLGPGGVAESRPRCQRRQVLHARVLARPALQLRARWQRGRDEAAVPGPLRRQRRRRARRACTRLRALRTPEPERRAGQRAWDPPVRGWHGRRILDQRQHAEAQQRGASEQHVRRPEDDSQAHRLRLSVRTRGGQDVDRRRLGHVSRWHAAADRHGQALDPGQPARDRRDGSGLPGLERVDRQRRSDGLPGVPGHDAGCDPRRGHLIHPHQRRAGHLQLHGARRRRGRQRLGPEQRRERDGRRHDEADAAHAHRDTKRGAGRAELAGRHGQRRGHPVPALPGNHADRNPREHRHLIYGRGPRSRRLQLHGAGRRRGGQRLGSQQHGERDGSRHHPADDSRQPHRDGKRGPDRPELAGIDGQRGSHRIRGLPGTDADRDARPGCDVLHGQRSSGRLPVLRGALVRCGRQLLRLQQHRKRDRSGHDEADHARHPERFRAHLGGRGPHLAGRDGRRGRDGLQGLPRRHPDRQSRRLGDVLLGHGRSPPPPPTATSCARSTPRATSRIRATRPL